MHSLSAHAKVILERMEPDRLYGAQDIRAFVPECTVERIREIMHELWIDRQVERVEYCGWRRQRTGSPQLPLASPASREIQHVTPEELFDHARFADFFK